MHRLVKSMQFTRGAVFVTENKVAMFTFTNNIRIWDYASKKPLYKLTKHTKPVTCIAALSRERLASGSEDGTIFIWNIEKGRAIKRLQEHVQPIRSLVQAPNGRLASQDSQGTIKIWDLETEQSLVMTLSAELLGHVLSRPVFLADNRLCTCSYSSTSAQVTFWDLQGDEPRLDSQMDTSQTNVRSMFIIPEDALVLSSENGETKVYKLANKCVWVSYNFGSHVENIFVITYNALLFHVFGSDRYFVRKPGDDRFRNEYVHNMMITAIAIAPDLKTLLVTCRDGRINYQALSLNLNQRL